MRLMKTASGARRPGWISTVPCPQEGRRGWQTWLKNQFRDIMCDLSQAKLLVLPPSTSAQQYSVHLLQSPNTKEKATEFWRTVPIPRTDGSLRSVLGLTQPTLCSLLKKHHDTVICFSPSTQQKEKKTIPSNLPAGNDILELSSNICYNFEMS